MKDRCLWSVGRGVSGLPANFLRYERSVYLFTEKLHQFRNTSFWNSVSFDVDDPPAAEFWGRHEVSLLPTPCHIRRRPRLKPDTPVFGDDIK